ncbi:MAG: carbon monoxide dehydrogenase subunit G [Mycobacteriales bacterium]
MKVTGEATLHAPVARVWDALTDPAVLVRTIPGCQQLEAVAADEYKMTVTAGVASIKGTYLGSVRLTDQQHPSSFVLRAAGSGAPGTVQADVVVSLSDNGEGTTLLTYDADAVVGGTVGGVGQRMLAGVARKTAGEFFRAVDDVLTGVTSPVGGSDQLPAPGSVAPLVPPTVFTRPPGPGSPVDLRSLLLAGAVGAALALAGVAFGARLGRRR